MSLVFQTHRRRAFRFSGKAYRLAMLPELALLLCVFRADGWSQATNASRPQNTTAAPVTQLPLSGRGAADVPPVVIDRRPAQSGTANSVIVNNTTVTVQGPYAGSVASGKATALVLPLTLAQALGMGLRANLGALNQSAAAQQAEGQRLTARSQLLPQVDAGISESFEKINIRTLGVSSPMFPTSSTFNFYDARVRLNQSVLDFVRIRTLHGATENVKASIAAARNARDLVVLAVGGSYLQLTASEARVQAAEAQVRTSRTIYEQARDRFEAGLANRVDVNRAQVELQTEEQRLRALEADRETEKLRLARLIGLPLAQAFTAADVYDYAPGIELTPEAALQRAEARRPDLLAAQAAMKAAEETVRAAHAERLPNLGVNADFGAAGITPTNHSVDVFTVTGTLTVPIYEGGRIHADAVQAGAALKLRKAELEDTRGQIEQDVRQAFIDLRSAADQVDVAHANVKLAHETLTQSSDRFLVGVADTVEVVQAEQAVVQADDDAVTALFEYNLAKVSLARAMGDAEQSLPQLLKPKP